MLDLASPIIVSRAVGRVQRWLGTGDALGSDTRYSKIIIIIFMYIHHTFGSHISPGRCL